MTFDSDLEYENIDGKRRERIAILENIACAQKHKEVQELTWKDVKPAN